MHIRTHMLALSHTHARAHSRTHIRTFAHSRMMHGPELTAVARRWLSDDEDTANRKSVYALYLKRVCVCVFVYKK